MAALDPFDGIATAARREAHIDDDAFRRRRPRLANRGTQ
jgi:hypothetical protein